MKGTLSEASFNRRRAHNAYIYGPKNGLRDLCIVSTHRRASLTMNVRVRAVVARVDAVTQALALHRATVRSRQFLFLFLVLTFPLLQRHLPNDVGGDSLVVLRFADVTHVGWIRFQKQKENTPTYHGPPQIQAANSSNMTLTGLTFH